MSLITMEISGMKELYGKLDRLGSATTREAVYSGLIAAEPILSSSIRGEVPVLTGALASKLSHELVAKGETQSLVVGFTKKAFPGKNAFYAAFLEYGHHAGGRRKFGVSTRRRSRSVFDFRPLVPAEPFARPGFSRAAPAALDAFMSAAGRHYEESASLGGAL